MISELQRKYLADVGYKFSYIIILQIYPLGSADLIQMQLYQYITYSRLSLINQATVNLSFLQYIYIIITLYQHNLLHTQFPFSMYPFCYVCYL